MIDILGGVAVIILSLIGLFMIVVGLVVVWIAYRYDINVSIHTKDKGTAEKENGEA